jgi:hypothetical protein
MKALPNLAFLLLLLLGMPVCLYYMYTKTFSSNELNQSAIRPSSGESADVQINNLEIARLKKENAELKTRKLSPLAQPPRPLGQSAPPANPNSQSLLSQPPRRLGQGSKPCRSTQECDQINRHDE